MGNISKIKIGSNAPVDIKDASLTEKVSIVEEVVSRVLNRHEDNINSNTSAIGTNTERIAEIDEVFAAAINDLEERKYEKPNSGIPATDLASAVQTSLGNADTAYQQPSGGIPVEDLNSSVQTSLGKADSAYQKPANGIPSTDFDSSVQTSLGKADGSEQTSNKTTSLSSSSTDTEYPSAKCVYDYIGTYISGIETLLANI